MTLPAIPETPLPPDRPHVAQCHDCRQWVPEVGWADCEECQKPTCPRCQTALDVATIGDVAGRWRTTRMVKILVQPFTEEL